MSGGFRGSFTVFILLCTPFLHICQNIVSFFVHSAENTEKDIFCIA